jgi:hypothetical protein
VTAAPEDERFIPERSALEAALLRELAETWDEIADNHFNKPGTLGGFPDPPARDSARAKPELRPRDGPVGAPGADERRHPAQIRRPAHHRQIDHAIFGHGRRRRHRHQQGREPRDSQQPACAGGRRHRGSDRRRRATAP